MRKKPTIPKPARRRWKPAAGVLTAMLLAGGIVLLVNLLGGEALRRVGGHGRYRTNFADIRCDPPPGLDRATFLAEVRYLSGFPESLHGLDEEERNRLASAFARHPWVESVQSVEAEPGNVVSVKLTFRAPVLAVRLDRGAVRLVDAGGVLLPESEPPRDVAELMNLVPAPQVAAGESWPEDLVLRSLDMLKSYPLKSLERTATGWRLVRKDGTTLHVEK